MHAVHEHYFISDRHWTGLFLTNRAQASLCQSVDLRTVRRGHRRTSSTAAWPSQIWTMYRNGRVRVPSVRSELALKRLHDAVIMPLQNWSGRRKLWHQGTSRRLFAVIPSSAILRSNLFVPVENRFSCWRVFSSRSVNCFDHHYNQAAATIAVSISSSSEWPPKHAVSKLPIGYLYVLMK